MSLTVVLMCLAIVIAIPIALWAAYIVFMSALGVLFIVVGVIRAAWEG